MRTAIAALFGCALLAASLPAEEITLREAIGEALSRHPSIAAADAGREGARARLVEARAGWLPRAELSAVTAQSNNPVFVFGSLLEQGRFGPQNFDPVSLNDPDRLRNDRLAITLRYALFDQFRRFDTTLEARNGVTQAGAAAEDARQRLRLEVMRRFFDVALAQERIEVTRQAVLAAEAQATALREKFSTGLIVESDFLSASVQLAADRQQHIAAEGELAIARGALALALQRPVADSLVATRPTEMPQLPELPLEEAIASGLAARSEIRSARLAENNAALQVRSTRGLFLPRVDLFATRGASGPTFRDRNYDSTAGAAITLDLDGGKLARVAQAKAAQVASAAAADLARDRVTMEILSAWHHTRAARERVNVASEASEQARSAAEMVRDRYENGLTTITEHLRAQSALVRARLDLLAARYDYLLGYAELLRSTGGLHDVDLFS